jgi:filamentous hemagglutinin
MISQNESGDSSATTRSAISAGTINVTNGAGQTQDIASLSRDATNTNGTVAKTPDVNNILNQQADTMAAAQAAGQTVSQGIGAYADMKRDDAAAAYKAASDRGDSAGMAAAVADYNNWKEGGDSRAELHVAGGALIGGLGGGSAFSTIGGAAGAGMASKMAGTLDDISKGVASATGSDLIGNLAANIAAGVGGAAVGGTAGAAMASNVHLYNQSVDDERALTGDLGKKTTSLFSFAMQGIANGLSAIVGMGGGGPPAASPGAVLVNGAGQALAAGTASSGSTIAGYGDGFSTLNVQDNKAKGDAWESEKADAARSDYPQVGQQITIKTSDGTRSRVDIMTRDNQGTIGCIECKASDDAPLTKNQAIAFPLLESQGAVIVGKGKPGFEGGTVIPPTKVQIVRPPSNGAGK